MVFMILVYCLKREMIFEKAGASFHDSQITVPFQLFIIILYYILSSSDQIILPLYVHVKQ